MMTIVGTSWPETTSKDALWERTNQHQYHHKTGAHLEPSGQKDKAEKHLAQRSRDGKAGFRWKQLEVQVYNNVQ